MPPTRLRTVRTQLKAAPKPAPRPSATPDAYAIAYVDARRCIERRMRGERLDVQLLAGKLAPLPQSVCRTLLGSVSRKDRDAVLASVSQRQRRPSGRVTKQAKLRRPR
jgi:hypothetical protein